VSVDSAGKRAQASETMDRRARVSARGAAVARALAMRDERPTINQSVSEATRWRSVRSCERCRQQRQQAAQEAGKLPDTNGRCRRLHAVHELQWTAGPVRSAGNVLRRRCQQLLQRGESPPIKHTALSQRTCLRTDHPGGQTI